MFTGNGGQTLPVVIRGGEGIRQTLPLLLQEI
jgi:hypothetical protein